MAPPFRILAQDARSKARRGTLTTAHGAIETPAFMTVGTRATVTGLDPDDLARVGTQVVLGNTYHLLLRPGPEALERAGGIHRWMGWDGPMLTDSGGFQIFSLSSERTVREEAATFRSYIDNRRVKLSPERSIDVQRAIGADIMMVLDVCPDARAPEDEVRAAMERTHRWALRSLAAAEQSPVHGHRQSLFAIVQGGVSPDMRRESAAFLTEHPFDGFALGGLAVGDTREQREAITSMADELLPADKPRYLMGVGTPADLLIAVGAGVDLFDCMLPTHMAWQGTAYTSSGRVKITRGAYAESDAPLDEACACRGCRRVTRRYLHHLFKCKEPLGYRLLSLHNLTYVNALMRDARSAIEAGEYEGFARRTLRRIDRHEHAPAPPTHRVVRTSEGAAAVIDDEVGEVMHPVVGPRIEARALYVAPSRLEARLGEPGTGPGGELVLYDVGLGAGSNALAAWRVSEARADDEVARLRIVSFDRTPEALALAASPGHAAEFGFEGGEARAAAALLDEGAVVGRRTSWSLVLGELPGALSERDAEELADVVFWDPFSPAANPALWTVGAFTALRRRCGPRATVHTYGAATATRTALLLAGFFVGRGPGSGSKGETTIAAVALEDLDEPLGPRFVERVRRSSAPWPVDAGDAALAALEAHPQFSPR